MPHHPSHKVGRSRAVSASSSDLQGLGDGQVPPHRIMIGLQMEDAAMDDDRLVTDVWVMAHVRRCNNDGVPAMVVRKGNLKSGMLMLKINQIEGGCRVLSQMRDLDGAMGWLPAFKGALVSEPDADAYIERAIDRDPDLWVVEIEDRTGRNPFEGKEL